MPPTWAAPKDCSSPPVALEEATAVDKDLYVVLGVRPDASAAEIRRTYRELAKESHPDQFVDQGKKIMAEAESRSLPTVPNPFRDPCPQPVQPSHVSSPVSGTFVVHTTCAVHRFMEISEAYEVLADKTRRRANGLYVES